jgi:outer membrane protein
MRGGALRALARTAASALVAGSFAVSVSAETLTDALISAYDTSGLLEQNRALLRAADEDVAQAVASLRPVLSYLASVNWTDPVQPGQDNTSAGLALSADWLLYDFGRTELGVDAAKEQVLALRAALVGVEQQVLLRAVAAYMNVRQAIAFVELNDNSVRVIGEQLRAAQDRFEVGEVTRTDVSVVEARLAAARSALAGARGRLEEARQESLAVVGRLPANLQAPPAAPATANSLDAATSIALARHPSIQRAQREVAASDLAVRRAEASRMPSLNAGAQFSVDDDRNDRQSLSLTLRGPIYQGGAISSAVRAAQARRDATRAALLVTTQQVVQDVAVAWSNVQVASAVIVASDEQVRAAQLALRGAREELEVGESTTIDVLDREQELLQAQTNRIDAQVNRYVAVYQLLSRMGLLTVEHLGLGIPTYDPAAYYNAVRNAPLGTVSPQGERLDRMLRAIGRD